MRSVLTFAYATLLLLFSLLFFGQALAWPPTYGSEYNFSSQKTEHAWALRGHNARWDESTNWQEPGPEEFEAAEVFAARVKALCGDECKIVKHVGKYHAVNYQVIFNDGYGFNISVDHRVVEIQTQPETLEELKKNEARVQKYIFDVAASPELDLTAAAHEAGGQFNIGILSAFEGDPKGFLKYFVNYHNFPELASGILGKNYLNAPPLSHLNAIQRKALSRITDDVNKGRIKTVQEVALRIRKEVYTDTPRFKEGPEYYQGVGMKNIDENVTPESDRPFELRGIRQPRNAHERTLLAELMEIRMKYEIQNEDPIAFLDVPKVKEYDPEVLANRFRLYVREMGGDWDYFKALLPESLASLPEDAFLAGKIDWKSKKDIALVKSYTRYLASSPWVRKQMLDLLQSPEAIRSRKVPQLLEAAKMILGPDANAGARFELEEFTGSMNLFLGLQRDLRMRASCILKNITGRLKPKGR
jgi:hypothetical protein